MKANNGRVKKSCKTGNYTYWIKATLSNDEGSTDDQLIDYFMTEGKMTKDEAIYWIGQRSYYLNNIR
jgi:hypothetical protein